ncbi:MAG: hypothetical protein KDM91_15215 [Verrucomicrobiae bacterium]|nr:hypothetical protein [Verrucomicrobiae bacterium]MCP5541798.1 hypothetical protein [Akkermansiaceae bacterium]
MTTAPPTEPTPPAPPDSPSVRPARKRVLGLIGAICLVHLWLATRSNEFHFQQHPDEISKIEQILENRRNLHHPLLMINAVDLAAKLRASVTPRRYDVKYWVQRRLTPQQVVEMGRMFSALCTTLGIFLAAAAFVVTGRPWAGVGAAALMAPNYSIVLAAHFFKEDAALCLGLGAYLFTWSLFSAHPTRRRAILTGVATALLLSGKWAGGIFILGHWIALLAWGDRKTAFRWLGWQLGVFCLVFAAINHQIFAALPTFREAISGEVRVLTVGRDTPGTLLGKYNWWPLGWLNQEPGLSFLLASGVALAAAFAGWFGRPWRTLAFVPIAYTLTLGLTDKFSARYILPSGFLVLMFSGALLGRAAEGALAFPAKGWRLATLAVVGALAIAAIAVQAANTRHLPADLRVSPHEAAWTWIRENLDGKPAKLMQIRRHLIPRETGLFDPATPPLPVELSELNDRGLTYEALKKSGATHLIFRTMERNNRTRGVVDPGLFDDLDRLGKKVFEAPPGPVGIIQPGIEIYEIR